MPILHVILRALLLLLDFESLGIKVLLLVLLVAAAAASYRFLILSFLGVVVEYRVLFT